MRAPCWMWCHLSLETSYTESAPVHEQKETLSFPINPGFLAEKHNISQMPPGHAFMEGANSDKQLPQLC